MITSSIIFYELSSLLLGHGLISFARFLRILDISVHEQKCGEFITLRVESDVNYLDSSEQTF